MFRLLRTPSAVLITLLASTSALASTAPLTPIFVQAWSDSPGAFPAGVATDGLGNVYVCEESRIVKFDRRGNIMTQWGSIGTGPGQFNVAHDLAVDPSGNVFVADYANHRIQKFSSNGAYLSQWGVNGSGNGQFNGPTGVATDAAGNVFVVDFANNRIQKFDGNGTYLLQWGSNGSGNGQFGFPLTAATDGAGNVYVADQGNSRVQKFTNTGVYVTQWGTNGSGNGQFNYPLGIATDAAGNVYVTDQYNSRVQKFSSTGTYLTQWGTTGSGNGQFSTPIDVATDAAGNVYVADWDNARIQKFSSAGVPISEAPAAFLRTWGTAGSSNGQFSSPFGAATDAAGNVYVVDRNNNRIQKFSSTGSYLLQWGAFGSGNGQFNAPTGIATDAAGSVYVVDYSNHRIEKFNGTGGYLAQWGTNGIGNGQFVFPFGVATDAAGNVYVADRNNHRIQKFSSTGTFLTAWGSNGTGNAQFVNPNGVATDAAGNVYVADTDNHRIQKFGSGGGYIGKWGTLGTGNGQFQYPLGVSTDAAGNVYVSDTYNHRIQKFTGAGTYLTQWGSLGSATGQFTFPLGTATDGAGNLYVADESNHRIQKFTNPPAIALVSDVRNDQGRQVRLRVLRSSADFPGSGTPILRYDIFRRIDPLPGPRSISADGLFHDAAPAGQLAGWDQVGSFSAYGESEYNVVVPTLVDATAASLQYSAFMIRAATSDPLVSFDSGTENGFSVDNLSPPAPTPFTAAYATGATHLHWGVSPASDFASFRLYRGTSADFLPEPGNLVTATTDTGYVDAGDAGRWYKLSAVDLNGNESPYAVLGPNQTTDAPAAGPFVLALQGTRPNPAIRGRMVVHFELPGSQPSRLEVIDVSGRRVREREVGSMGAGRHAVDLTGDRPLRSGLYFIRLVDGARELVVRATVLP